MTSSPRHRTTGSPTTFRLMVSTGGHILPRPHDKSLRYVGGDTRVLTVDRHSTLSDLTNRLSKTVISTRSSATSSSTSSVQFTLKYQLPMEDLDSLVSVTNDEDLENMIDECERLTGSASRIRLFIFPKPNQNCSDSVSEIGLSLFLENKDNPSKSEDWFLNALNGTSPGFFSDTSSVKCLLDLDDQILLPEKKDGRGDNSGHDVRSIPDSPMLETTSSFGSASSQANLPPVEDCLKILSSPAAPVVVSGSPVSSWTHSDPFLSFHEKTDQGLQVDYLKHGQQQSTGLELGSIDSILSDLTITDQSSPVSQIQSSNYNNQVVDPDHDQNNGIQMQQQQQQRQQQNPHNSSYLMPMSTTQPQFIPQPQYIHSHPHHHPSVAVPVTSYYHHPPPDQQTFMYYIPTTHPPQGYNFSLQQQQQPQPTQADTRSVAPTKTDLPPGVYRTNSGGPQLVRIPSGYQNQPQHVGYSGIHQPTQSMYYATTLSTGQQVRTGQP